MFFNISNEKSCFIKEERYCIGNGINNCKFEILSWAIVHRNVPLFVRDQGLLWIVLDQERHSYVARLVSIVLVWHRCRVREARTLPECTRCIRQVTAELSWWDTENVQSENLMSEVIKKLKYRVKSTISKDTKQKVMNKIITRWYLSDLLVIECLMFESFSCIFAVCGTK